MSSTRSATPLIELTKVAAGLRNRVFVKCEHMNPGGSVKDRTARAIILDAEARGVLVPPSRAEDDVNVVGALRVAARADIDGPIVTIAADLWDRYRSTPWMKEWEAREASGLVFVAAHQMKS